MPNQSRVRFFVVDAGRGRLLECSRTPAGRLHVDEIESIENDHEAYEHGRPSPRAGKSGNTYASGGHESEHQLHRFAKEVAVWIERKSDQLGLEAVSVFSAPRFLGELRKLYGPALARRVREHSADLTHLAAAGLARHPAVEELLPPPGP
jgi:protein required for attachment to host cells